MKLSSLFALAFLLGFQPVEAAFNNDLDCPSHSLYVSSKQDPLLVSNIPTSPYFPAPGPVDLVGYGMSFNATTLVLNATLREAPPFGDSSQSYRYWLGFNVKLDDGSTQYLDVRVSGTSTYDSGDLVGSNEMGNPSLATLPAEWVGSMLIFRVPIHLMQTALRKDFHLGEPIVGSDGPQASTEVQTGFSWADRIIGPAEYFAIPTCPPRPLQLPPASTTAFQFSQTVSSTPDPSSNPPSHPASTLTVASISFVLGAAVLFRRRN